jgi:hypothetical protein
MCFVMVLCPDVLICIASRGHANVIPSIIPTAKASL